jgi:hypothetical protein
MRENVFYKRPSDYDEYVAEAIHAIKSPKGESNGQRHDHARDGQTVLAVGAVNNVGVSCLPIENALMQEGHFGGGVDFTEIDVLLRDTELSRGAKHTREGGALKVVDD